MKKIFTYFFIFIASYCNAQILRGEIHDAVNNKALQGANIVLQNSQYTTQSDSNGVFRLENIATNTYTAEISYVGYEKAIVKDIEIKKGADAIVNIDLLPSENELNTVVVNGERNNIFNRLQTQYPLSVAQTIRFPAAFNDPARLAMNCPGVINDNDLANGLSIHGYSPEAMQWRLEGVEILNPNHLSNASNFNGKGTISAGGTNALSSQMLGTSNLITGGYSAEYNNFFSGVMDMRLRNGDETKHHLTTQIGLVGLDVAAEGPISKKTKSSYLVNYRYSTVGLLLKMGVPLSEEKINFQDLAWNFNFPLGKKSELKVFGMLGNSKNTFETKKDSIRDDRDLKDEYFSDKLNIYGLSFKYNMSKKVKLLFSAVHSHTNPVLKRNLYNQDFTLQSQVSSTDPNYITSANLSIEHRINQRLLFRYGTVASYYKGAFFDNFSKDYHTYYSQNLFAEGRYTVKKHTFMLGINELLTKDRKEIYLNPFYYTTRASYAFKWNSNEVVGSISLLRKVYFPDEENKSLQYSISFNTYHDDWELKLNAFFHNNYFNGFYEASKILLPIRNNFSNLQYGDFDKTKNFGIGAAFDKKFNRNFFFNTNLSLYRALIPINGNSTFNTTGGFYDGVYASNITLSKEWQRATKRYGISTHLINNGSNYIIDNNNNPITSISRYSFKHQNYFRTDLRLYLKRDRKSWSSTLSLDIQNVTNQKNIAYAYYDTYLKKQNIKYQNGLIPILAWRANF